MKCKWAILLVCLLVSSTLSLAAAEAKVRCPTCDGSGEISCPYCDGTGSLSDEAITTCTHCEGSGRITPRVYMMSMDYVLQGEGLNITSTFENQETFEVNGTVTAIIDGQVKGTSAETTFPPKGEYATVNLYASQGGLGGSTYIQIMNKVDLKANTGEVTCPYCDGAGTTSSGETCPDCDGTGTLVCPDCDGTGRVTESQLAEINGGEISGGTDFSMITWGVVVAAVVGVGATSFFMLKKRRVSEKSLRRMSSGEFQRWVIKKLDGKDATSSDLAVGIDGFSRAGEPLSIKQSDSVDMLTIDRFASGLAKSRVRSGTVVAFGFGADAIRGKVRARTNYKIDIQMVTVQELMFRR